jgi:uncharacterized protein involved in exopolysaccharide biosynthesis
MSNPRAEPASHAGRAPRRVALLIAAAAALCATAALASETITYDYDARGRLTKTVRTGSVNNNVAAQYGYDKADNRTLKTVTGSPNN